MLNAVPKAKVAGKDLFISASKDASILQSGVSAKVCLAKSMDDFEWAIIFPTRSAQLLSESGPGRVQRFAHANTVNLAGWTLAPFLSNLLRACAHIHAHAYVPYT